MKREHWLALFLSASTIPCHAGGAAPSYTDEDLARVHTRSAETGVLSVPAFPPEAAAHARAADPHGESYWRREAERLVEQLRPLRREADALRSKIARAAAGPARPAPRIPTRTPKRKSRTTARTPPRVILQPPAPDTRAFEDQLHALEREIRDRETQLEERARRESALPGWIR